MIRASNRNARALVTRRQDFKANNIFGAWNEARSLYVVTSYGDHYPLLVYDTTAAQWFENCDRYSITTSKHKSQVAQHHVTATSADTVMLRELVQHGSIVNWVAHRMGETP